MKLVKSLSAILAALVLLGAIVYLVVKYLDILLKPYYILKDKLGDMCTEKVSEIIDPVIDEEPDGI